MKHQHGIAGCRRLITTSQYSPRSLHASGIGYCSQPLYRSHTNTAITATGSSQVISPIQGHDDSTSHSKRLGNTLPFSSFLTDTHSRQHTYLRISLTERCNLRCTYCMPEAGVPLSPQVTQLTTPEILLLSSVFVSQGVNKIRLTGGEPTVRKDIVPLMQQLGDLRSRGLRELCITSNGLVLKNKLDSMHKAGLTGVNLSLDTLDPGLFMIMTRRRGFERVVETMERILEMNRVGAGIELKINVVVMKGVNDSEILRFVELGKEKDLEVRFIEYMPFDENKWARTKMVTYRDMLHTIQAKYPELEKIVDGKGDTSKKYRVPGFAGRIGFITSMTDNFCAGCNRLRITSDGNLKVCLFGNTEVSLRDLIRKENHGQPIDEMVFEAMKKAESTDNRSVFVGNETELLQAIGQAVGRKKAQHAGMGVLEKTKNRPMILIDDPIPIVRKGFHQRSKMPNYPGGSLLDMSMIQAPSQFGFQRFFSTATRTRGSAENSKGQSAVTTGQPTAKSAKQDQSFKEHLSARTEQSSISLGPEYIQHKTTMPTTESPTIDAGEMAENHNSESFDEVCQIISQLEGELGFLRNQVQTLVSQHSDDSKSASVMNDQIKQYKELIDSEEPENKETIGKPLVRKVVPIRSSTRLILEGSLVGLPHLDSRSAVHMVSVAKKPVTGRKAIAVGTISLNDQAFDAIASHLLEKGDVLSIARIAAIQAAKKTSDIIPLCHPGLPIEGIKVDIALLQFGRALPSTEHIAIDRGLPELRWWMGSVCPGAPCIKMSVVVESSGKTGIEMEALTGVTAGLLTVYDMCKSINREAEMRTQLWYKSGGLSGTWMRTGSSI